MYTVSALKSASWKVNSEDGCDELSVFLARVPCFGKYAE